MHLTYRPLYILSIIGFCAQFSSQQSIENGSNKQPVNFKVKITIHGNTFNADNFSIGGLYRQIPFFAKQADPEADPTSDTTYIDLDEIHSIKPAYTNPREGIFTFKNRPYIELIITFRDTKQTEAHYVVETSRKIFCDELLIFENPERPQEEVTRELMFEAIDMIIIEGYMQRVPEKFKEKEKRLEASSRTSDKSQEIKKDENCSGILKRIDILMEDVYKITPEELQNSITLQLQELKTSVMPLCN